MLNSINWQKVGEFFIYIIIVAVFVIFLTKFGLLDTPKKPQNPTNSGATTLPACAPTEYKMSDWGICNSSNGNSSGTQDRSYIPLSDRAISGGCVVIENLTQNCSIDDSHKIKRVSLFGDKGYTTKVNLDNGKDLEYSDNIGNVSITATGKIQSLSIEFTALTTVLDGRIIQRDTPYYVMFAINDKIPRILGTERIFNGNISELGVGVINGLDMPKTLKFNLSNIMLANAKNPNEGLGSKQENYVEILNKNSGNPLIMTLHLGGSGRGMLEIDEQKKIFGKIKEAYLEYTCEQNSNCSIEIK